MSPSAFRTWVMLCAIIVTPAAGAQFLPPETVTDGGGGYTAPEMPG